MFKLKFALPLLATVTFFAAPQSVGAAQKKADPKVVQLVAALEAVSPDPLGGRFGFALATGYDPKADLASQTRLSAKVAGADADRLAYQSWKNAKKS